MDNQQPSSLKGKGSSTIPAGSTEKSREMESTSYQGEDIVKSLGKPKAVVKRKWIYRFTFY